MRAIEIAKIANLDLHASKKGFDKKETPFFTLNPSQWGVSQPLPFACIVRPKMRGFYILIGPSQ